MKKGLNITIVSWPPLWIYWPMYVALAKAAKSISNVRFRLEVPEGIVTDDVIRRSFFRKLSDRKNKSHADHDLFFALCEPGEARPSDGIKIRKMPLLWRQPHWLIANRDSVVGLMTDDRKSYTESVKLLQLPFEEFPENSVVWCYPMNTTSGDFARTVFRGLPALRKKNVIFKDLDSKDEIETLLTNARDDRASSGAGERTFLFSFTPYHQQVRSDRVIAIAEFAGPSRDITALLMPDETTSSNRSSTDELYQIISLHLKQILGSLADTQGNYGEIEQYLKTLHRSIDMIIEGKDFPNLYDLAGYMSEYVKHGCYFPYRIIDAAIGTEISRLVEKRLDDAKQKAVEDIQHDLDLFLESKRDWSKLSFHERAMVQTTWGPKEEGFGQEEQPLWERLIHPTSKDKETGYENWLRLIRVHTDSDTEHVPLVSLNALERQLVCSNNPDAVVDHQADAGVSFECRGTLGKINQGQASGEKKPCFLCNVCGLPGAMLIAGALTLAEPVLKMRSITSGSDPKAIANPAAPVEYCAFHLRDPEDRHSFGTLLCWDDISEMFHIFREELRVPDVKSSRPPVYIIMGSDWDDEGNGNILLSIFWRGGIESHTSGRGAKNRLEMWAKEHSKAGRPLSNVSFWFNEPDEHFVEIYTPKVNRRGRSISEMQLWEIAKSQVQLGSYTFAYVAVFDCYTQRQEQ
jgi:hypothetical protein